MNDEVQKIIKVVNKHRKKKKIPLLDDLPVGVRGDGYQDPIAKAVGAVYASTRWIVFDDEEDAALFADIAKEKKIDKISVVTPEIFISFMINFDMGWQYDEYDDGTGECSFESVGNKNDIENDESMSGNIEEKAVEEVAKGKSRKRRKSA